MILTLKFLVLLICCLISVAFYTLLERKVLSIIGYRLGPNKVSINGLFQPIGDAVKLSNKSVNLLVNFSFLFYYISSILLIFSTFLLWSLIFSEPSNISYKLSFVFFMLILGFNSLGSILSGWSTFSKFSLIGSIRTVSQLISYESVLYFCFFFLVFMYTNFNIFSFNFSPVSMVSLIMPILLICWVPSVLADLNRSPYDFSEGESELVSGFNTEFGSVSFTFLFLAEYGNIVFFCILSSFLFFYIFCWEFCMIMFFLIIWFRSLLPRFRFDKLMFLCWKFYIPFLTLYFILFIVFLI